eukprot:scaffold2822_cov100-Isochrysis_galbana.AAC.3
MREEAGGREGWAVQYATRSRQARDTCHHHRTWGDVFLDWVIGGRPWEQQWLARGSVANRLSLCHTGGRLAKAQGAGAGSCTRAMGMSAASRVLNQNGGWARGQRELSVPLHPLPSASMFSLYVQPPCSASMFSLRVQPPCSASIFSLYVQPLCLPPGCNATAEPLTPARVILRCSSFVKRTFAALESA